MILLLDVIGSSRDSWLCDSSFSEVPLERVAHFQLVYSSIINRALILNVAVANRQVRQTQYKREKWHVKKPIGSKAKFLSVKRITNGRIIA